jgi:hypothetical protein
MKVQERVEAIERFFEHNSEAYQRALKREQQSREDLVRWKESTAAMINQSVQRVSIDFAVLGSPFVFSSIPVQTEGSTAFRVKTSQGVRLLSKLQFDLADGKVTATASVPGSELPSSVPVRDVTGEWVEIVAERVLLAMLEAA